MAAQSLELGMGRQRHPTAVGWRAVGRLEKACEVPDEFCFRQRALGPRGEEGPTCQG